MYLNITRLATYFFLGGILAQWIPNAMASSPRPDDFLMTLMLKTSIQTVVTDCSARYPAVKVKLELQATEWKNANADRLKLADEKLAVFDQVSREAIEKSLDMASENAKNLILGAEKKGLGIAYCEGAMSEYGTKRKSDHLDAENLDEAIGMFEAWVISEQALFTKCMQISSESRTEMETSRQTWTARNSKILKFVNTQMSDYYKFEPELREKNRALIATQTDEIFAFLAKKNEHASKNYCQKQYHKFAEDKERLDAPKMYQFLEAAAK